MRFVKSAHAFGCVSLSKRLINLCISKYMNFAS